MKTNKKFFALMAFCALFAGFSFASCGSDDDDDKPNNGTENGNGNGSGNVGNPDNPPAQGADFCKTYNGLLDVLFSETHTKTIENVTIAKDAANSGKYSLSIRNFSFNGMVIGNIEVDNIAAKEDADGNTDLSAEGEVKGPETSVGVMIVTTTIRINSCKISKDGVLKLNLSVKLFEKSSGDYAGEDMDVVVSFDSSKKTTDGSDDSGDDNGGNSGGDDEEEAEEDDETI